jgi:hypothetical protein
VPTYSDDGRWWWDGRAWQPVIQQPPPPPYAGPPQQQMFYAQPPRQRSKAPWIIAMVVLLVIALIPVGIVGWRALSKDDNQAGGTAPAGPNGASGKIIEPGQPVTKQALSDVDALAFYESVVKRQMTAPIGRMRSAFFGDPQKFAALDFYTINDIAIDHKSDKFYNVKSILEGPKDDDPTNIVCVGSKEMHWFNSTKQWQASRFSSSSCAKKPFMGANDGIVSSGLTADQAQKVLDKLHTYKGYVNPAQPTLLSVGGKAYVRQVVDFKPITLADKNYWGTAISMWAFRDAGLDPVTWPWSNAYNLTAGVHMVYYLDPVTLMPVAAFQKGIDTPAQANDPAIKRPEIQVINYSFPKTLPTPALGKSPGTLTLALPEGWKVQ